MKAIIICSHAASILAIGRALTGRMPDNIEEQDFKPFTCGLSKFSRKSLDAHKDVPAWKEGDDIPRISWKNGAGVGGGWKCELNGDCSFLSGGEERGWRFSGDESFIAAKAATTKDTSELGVVVEPEAKPHVERRSTTEGASRL